MVSKRVLMCPPDYFQIEYEINPWMHLTNRVDPKKARREFDDLVKIYKSLGVKVDFIKPEKGLPDMVFAANLGFVVDKTFIRANFRYNQRRREAEFAQKYFKRQGFEVKSLPEGIFFEGQGDMFFADGHYYCGYGKRTAREALPEIEKIVGRKIFSLETRDPYYYHLDTCFAPLGQGRCVIKPTSFTKSDLEKVEKHFSYVVKVGEEDMPFFCCNLVVVGNTIVLGKGISVGIKSEFKRLGFAVVEVAMDEFLKSGGAVKCLTMEYFVNA